MVSIQPYPGLPRLYLAHNALRIDPQGYWYRNFLFRVERERGLDWEEDLFNPLMLRWKLDEGQRAVVIASTEAHDIRESHANRSLELERRDGLAQKAPIRDAFVRALVAAADQYLAQRDEGWTIMAGYPWFTDWGRDTMISLPGLTLCTGNFTVAREIGGAFSLRVSEGMRPNRLNGVHSSKPTDSADYNTVDATLWFFEAARAYAAASSDYDFLQDELYPVFADIIEWHVRGTRFGIRMEDNGLLHAGEPGVQLTWMDAKVGDRVITPPTGKPVALQALCHN